MSSKKRVLVIVESLQAYDRNIAGGIAQYVRERDHWTIRLDDRGHCSFSTVLGDGWDGDGIIFRSANAELRRFLKKKIACPVVELLGDGKDIPVEIASDEPKVLELCVDHFLERGFKSLAFFSFGKNHWISRRRELFQAESLRKKFQAYYLSEPGNGGGAEAALTSEWTRADENALVSWLKTLPRQTGVIAACDTHAVRVLQACQQIHLSVPDEIAILGIDNDTHLCQLMTPQLSSLDQNANMLGYEAARLLDWKMAGKKTPPHPIAIPPLYVVQRRSTDVVAVDDPDVAAAIHFIRENATQGILVSDVVKEVNLSKSTLIRQFQKHIGRSPKDEITRVCLNHAEYLLIHTNLSINEVARKSGYRSLEYFVSMFRQKSGFSPMKFRKRNQKLFDDHSAETEMDEKG